MAVDLVVGPGRRKGEEGQPGQQPGQAGQAFATEIELFQVGELAEDLQRQTADVVSGQAEDLQAGQTMEHVRRQRGELVALRSSNSSSERPLKEAADRLIRLLLAR